MKSEKKLVFKTWDQMCLDKLREIGKSGLTRWAVAMGYTNQTCMTKTSKFLLEKGLVRDTPNPGGRVRRYYEAI